MSQQFEGDAAPDLMADSMTASEDDAFTDESYGDGFEEEGMDDDSMQDDSDYCDENADAYGDEAYLADDDFEDSFEEDTFEDDFVVGREDSLSALEEAVVAALDAESSDAFVHRLIAGIQTGGNKSGGRQAPRRGASSRLLPLLQQHIAHGADEGNLFKELVDWFKQENADEALPVLAGVAARAALKPLIRGGTVVGRGTYRQIVRGTTQAARQLVSQQGRAAIGALRSITTSVGRVAARRGMKPTALTNAIRQATTTVATQPALIKRLAQPVARATGRAAISRSRLSISGEGGVPRRFVVNGPVEIIIRR